MSFFHTYMEAVIKNNKASTRELWKLVESFSKEHNIKLEIHKSGKNLLWIDLVSIPKELRGNGLGKKFIELIERAAKNDGVSVIKIYAGDTGAGRSNLFWEKMGFAYDNPIDAYDHNDKTLWNMSKKL